MIMVMLLMRSMFTVVVLSGWIVDWWLIMWIFIEWVIVFGPITTCCFRQLVLPTSMVLSTLKEKRHHSWSYSTKELGDLDSNIAKFSAHMELDRVHFSDAIFIGISRSNIDVVRGANWLLRVLCLFQAEDAALQNHTWSQNDDHFWLCITFIRINVKLFIL